MTSCVKPLNFFEQRPKVLEYYHNLFSYIMVDEYQDTNGVQFRLVKLLADKHKNLCVVGDDDQSIYRFRGQIFVTYWILNLYIKMQSYSLRAELSINQEYLRCCERSDS